MYNPDSHGNALYAMWELTALDKQVDFKVSDVLSRQRAIDVRLDRPSTHAASLATMWEVMRDLVQMRWIMRTNENTFCLGESQCRWCNKTIFVEVQLCPHNDPEWHHAQPVVDDDLALCDIDGTHRAEPAYKIGATVGDVLRGRGTLGIMDEPVVTSIEQAQHAYKTSDAPPVTGVSYGAPAALLRGSCTELGAPPRENNVSWLTCPGFETYESIPYNDLPRGHYVLTTGGLRDHYYGPFLSWMAGVAGVHARREQGVRDADMSITYKES